MLRAPKSQNPKITENTLFERARAAGGKPFPCETRRQGKKSQALCCALGGRALNFPFGLGRRAGTGSRIWVGPPRPPGSPGRGPGPFFCPCFFDCTLFSAARVRRRESRRGRHSRHPACQQTLADSSGRLVARVGDNKMHAAENMRSDSQLVVSAAIVVPFAIGNSEGNIGGRLRESLRCGLSRAGEATRPRGSGNEVKCLGPLASSLTSRASLCRHTRKDYPITPLTSFTTSNLSSNPSRLLLPNPQPLFTICHHQASQFT